MRKDFAKVITNQPPRGGSSRRNIKTRMRLRRWDPEIDEYSGPLRISGKAGGFDRKSSGNARRQPLQRFLNSQIGQPWNRIWSDARHLFDARSRTQKLFLDLLHRKVECNCFVGQDGVIYEGHLFDGRHWKVSGFYVHPQTGKLEWAERSWLGTRRESPEYPIILIVPDAETAYRRTNKIWYVQTYAAYDPEKIATYRFDAWLGIFIPVRHRELKDARKLYVVKQKQANRKELQEIKQHIANAPRLIEKRKWRKVTVGFSPDLRTVLTTKNVQANDILKSLERELKVARWLRYEREQRRLEKMAAA